jgi:hypothetical protein
MPEPQIEPAMAPNGGKFQPGRSGNPRGRPRKSDNVGQSVLKALDAKVTIKEGGKRKRVTKRDAAATQLANMSASGDLRAGKLAFDLAQKAEDRAAISGPIVVPLTTSDREIVQRLVARLRLIREEPFDEPDHA